MTLHTDDTDLERARKRAARMAGFYAHLLLYVVVNVLLTVIDVAAGPAGGETVLALDWAYWSIIFWGVIVVIDAMTTFVIPVLLGEGWQRRQVDRYLARRQEA